MVVKYRAGVVPNAGPGPLDQLALRLAADYAAAMDRLDLRAALDTAWTLVSEADLYISRTAPWGLAKAGRQPELDQVLASLVRALYRLAVLVSPFMPSKAAAIWDGLGQAGKPETAPWNGLQAPPAEGVTVTRVAILFPKPESAPKT